MITLLDGSQVPESDIDFDSNTYHFHALSNGQDLTDLLSRADKLALVPGFDVTLENNRLSAEHGHGASYGIAPLPTSTTGILIDQLTHDPLAAPIEAVKSAANEIGQGVKDTLNSSGGKIIAIIGVAVLILYFSRK